MLVLLLRRRRAPLPLALLAAAATAASASAPVPGVNTTMAFATNASWPYAHNSGWAQLPTGRIVVVLQASNSTEGAPSQVILAATSDDGGATFPDPPRVVAGSGRAAAWGPVAFVDGAVLRVFFAQAPLTEPTLLCGDLMHTSSGDGGVTWTAPVLVLSRAAWGGGTKCSDNKPALVGPTQWALPFMSVAGSSSTSGLLAAAPGAGMAGPWAPLSGNISSPPHFNTSSYLSEPAVASCSAGTGAGGGGGANELLALLRNYERTWAARSSDGGASWGATFPTALTNPYSKVDLAVWPGGAPESRGPQAGALLLAHNPVANCSAPVYCPRTPLGVSWSPDCGASWSQPLLLEPTSTNPWGASYPTVGACGGGRVCVSYTLYKKGGFAGIRFAVFEAGLLPPQD
jgi:hypothetical protein